MTERPITAAEVARLNAEIERMDAELSAEMARLFYPRGRTAYLREFEARFGLMPSEAPR